MKSVDEWLRLQLSRGPVELTTICAATTGAGFTLMAAADALRRIGGRRIGTRWALIEPAVAAVAPTPTTPADTAAAILARRRKQSGHSHQPKGYRP